jgi:tetratricopeptide (TPR) repeat protein
MPNEQRRVNETKVVAPQTGLRAPERADTVAEAERHLRDGHVKDAIAALDAGIAATPGRLDLWRAMARIWRQVGNVEQADATLDTALKRFINEPDLLVDKAELRLFEDDFAGASKAFSRVTEIVPENAEGWLGKGRSLLGERKSEQALACAERVIALDGQSTSGYTLRGDSLLQLGQWEAAFAAFTEAANRDANGFDASNWTARGEEYRDYGQLELASRAYSRAIEQDPKNPEGWHGKGTVLKAQGNVDGALTAFQRASEVDKTFIAGFLDAGSLCVEHGNLNRALEFFGRAQTARPNDARPWLAIGGIHERLQQYDGARAAYEQATKLDPTDAGAWNSLGNSLYHLNHLDAALQSLQRAIEISPGYGWPYNNVAYVLLKLRRVAEAIQFLDKAVEIDPRNTVFWNNKLWALCIAGRFDEIEANAQLALKAAGDGVEQRVIAASFLAEADLVDRARELIHGVQPSALGNDMGRLRFAEILLLVGETTAAVTLLRTLTSAELSISYSVVQSFLHLVADRLVEKRLSEELLVSLLRRFGRCVIQFEAMGHKWGHLSLDWTANGVRRLIMRSELPTADKLVLAILADLQEARVLPADLSFFADMWPKLDIRLEQDPAPSAAP